MTSGATPRRLMMTAFGWNDSGGGTTVPRLAAKELARRGWEVTVFHAAVQQLPDQPPYHVREWEEDGVRLIAVHNRAHGLFDFGNPYREVDDPPITAAFATALDRARPDFVHFHNLHNLGSALFDLSFSRGLPAYFSTHNYWLVCPRAYLLKADGSMCDGPGHGSRCAACVKSADAEGHERRLGMIRSRAQRSLRAILAVSESVRSTLLAAGYPADLVDVVRQAMPHESEIWEQVGRHRTPGRCGEQLTVAFLGSAYPHKGPQLLVEAAQRTHAEIRVKIVGEVPERFAQMLRSIDRRGVAELSGAFAPSEIGTLLQGVDAVALPSIWWDCAPLAAAECLAAGTPLIVPRLGGLPEAICDGIDGLTFDGFDTDDLARQLDRLAIVPGLLERLQAAIEPPRAFADYVDELEAYYADERPSRVASSPNPTSISVRWQGDHGLATSLSIINDQITSRLAGPVRRIGRDDSGALDPPLPHAADVEVRHQWPPDLRAPTAGRLAVIQPWEFGAVPREWVEAIRERVDELWVPSEFVRQMYVAGGVDPDRVVAVPNGVDLTQFAPDGDALEIPGVAAGTTRFLFVGGLIWRKGPDLLLDAWRRAFPGRHDVVLVIKDFGAGGIYRGGDRGAIREHVASGEAPRIVLLEDQLEASEIAGLYRACDVLVHPYRGEGFAMPVLEAMASGLPAIVTEGGPTDEFCPPEAGWRIRASRARFPADRIDQFETAGTPWVLQPDVDHLISLLREAAADPAERRTRGAAAHAAAQGLSWDAVAVRYGERIVELAERTPLLARPRSAEPFPLTEDVELRILATPAWRTEDRLGQLLREWTTHTTRETSACLYLLADPHADGEPAELEAHTLTAATQAGADIDAGADINVLMHPLEVERDALLNAAMDAYVPLHAACSGHVRLARSAGNELLELGTGALGAFLKTVRPQSITGLNGHAVPRTPAGPA